MKSRPAAQELIKDKQCNLDFLIGKKVTNIGFVSGMEGGLAIDYEDDGNQRAILGFTDLGMWLAYNGKRGHSPTLKLMKEIRDNEDAVLSACSVTLSETGLMLKTEMNGDFHFSREEADLIPSEILKRIEEPCKNQVLGEHYNFLLALTDWAEMGG